VDYLFVYTQESFSQKNVAKFTTCAVACKMVLNFFLMWSTLNDLHKQAEAISV